MLAAAGNKTCVVQSELLSAAIEFPKEQTGDRRVRSKMPLGLGKKADVALGFWDMNPE